MSRRGTWEQSESSNWPRQLPFANRVLQNSNQARKHPKTGSSHVGDYIFSPSAGVSPRTLSQSSSLKRTRAKKMEEDASCSRPSHSGSAVGSLCKPKSYLVEEIRWFAWKFYKVRKIYGILDLDRLATFVRGKKILPFIIFKMTDTQFQLYKYLFKTLKQRHCLGCKM